MSSLKGDFIDSNNIVIVNDVPCFSLKGNSYLEKLKNGLSLDFIFMMEDSAVQQEYNFEENAEELIGEKQFQPLKYELFAEEYDFDVVPMPRKGKRVVRKRCNKNMKKNKVKQNGYNDKLYKIESNLPSIFDEATEWYVEYDVFDDDIDDNIDEDQFNNYRDYIEYYRRDSIDIFDEWDNANRTGRGWD